MEQEQSRAMQEDEQAGRRIAYTMTQADSLAAHRLHGKSVLIRWVRKLMLLTLIVFALVGAYGGQKYQMSPSDVIGAEWRDLVGIEAVCVLLGFIAYYPGIARDVARTWRTQKLIQSEITLTWRPWLLCFKQGINYSEVPLLQIMDFKYNDTTAILYRQPRLFIIVPRRVFPDAKTWDDFLQTCQIVLEQKKNGNRVAPAAPAI